MLMIRTMRHLLIGCAAVTAALTATAATADQTYKAPIRMLNQSRVIGQATLVLSTDKTQLTVKIDASGLEPGQQHVGHIHGRIVGDNMPADSHLPSRAQDSDRDKYVELAEGQVTYGPILITLGTNVPTAGGDLDPDRDGTIHYQQTFNLNDPSIYGAGFNKQSVLGDGTELELREIVIHGLSVPAVGSGTPGEVDGSAGYKVVLPIAGGEIHAVGKQSDDALRFRYAPRH